MPPGKPDDHSLRGVSAVNRLREVEQIGHLRLAMGRDRYSFPSLAFWSYVQKPLPDGRGSDRSREASGSRFFFYPMWTRDCSFWYTTCCPFDNAQWEVRMPVWNGPLAPMRKHATQIR